MNATAMTNSSTQEEAIYNFWNWFKLNNDNILNSRKNDSTRSELKRELQKINKELFYEIGVNSFPCEFVITPQGKKRLFPLVDEIISKCPTLPGWLFLALKPADGFDLWIQVDGNSLSTEFIICRPLEPLNGKLSLIIGFPDYENYDPLTIRQAVLLMLDSGLGERRHCNEIEHVKIVDRHKIEGGESISLRDLPRFLDWCSKNGATGTAGA